MEKPKVHLERLLNSFTLRVDLEVGPGIHVLFGLSGVGKTQTLEMIAGLSRPDRGRLSLGDRDFFRDLPDSASVVDLKSRERSIGYVFQDGLLFPHKTLLENVLYPLKKKRTSDRGRARQLLEEMELGHLADRYPGEVSGGQKRRAAIARALASDPRLLLLDEPFVHLDRVVRNKLMDDLENLVRRRQMIALLVTHDVEVAAILADTIWVLDQGRMIQSGPRDEVLLNPATGGVARLLGDVNILDGVVRDESEGLWRVESDSIDWRVPHLGPLESGQRVEVLVRTGAVKILKPEMAVPPSLQLNRHTAVIDRIDRRFDFLWIRFRLSEQVEITGGIPVDTFERSGLSDGDSCRLAVSIEGISLIAV